MINDDIKEIMGERFSAKDFRTWAGTMICANISPGFTPRRSTASPTGARCSPRR